MLLELTLFGWWFPKTIIINCALMEGAGGRCTPRPIGFQKFGPQNRFMEIKPNAVSSVNPNKKSLSISFFYVERFSKCGKGTQSCTVHIYI